MAFLFIRAIFLSTEEFVCINRRTMPAMCIYYCPALVLIRSATVERGGKGHTEAEKASGGDFAGPPPLRRPVWRRRGGGPQNRGADVYRLDIVVSRSRFCRRSGAVAPVRVRMAAELLPRRPGFLPLVAGDGGEAGWILFFLFVAGDGGAA